MSQSFLPQVKEEGPRKAQIRGHTRPPSDKQACDFSQVWTQSWSHTGVMSAGRFPTARPKWTAPKQSVPSFPGRQSGNP